MPATTKLFKAVSSPSAAVNYATSEFVDKLQNGKLELARRQRSIDLQRSHIDDFIDNDEFVLIVLDACRFDSFKRIHDSVLKGDLQKVWASGRWTADYTRRTWTDTYELTYLTTIPVISDFYFENIGMDYRPSNHIEKLVPLWDSDWDPSLGTVPPEDVTDSALTHASQPEPTRLVVHYSQPHAPYIGETQILPWDGELEDMRELLKKDIDRPTQRIYDRIETGDITKARLKQAYIDNLRCVLGEVVRLVRRVDCPVVITGDHGEHLGENGKFLHEEESVLIRQVPWFVVDGSEIGQTDIESRYAGRETNSTTHSQPSEEIKDRLANLGYTEE